MCIMVDGLPADIFVSEQRTGEWGHRRPQSVLSWMPEMDAGNICASNNQCIAIREGTIPFAGLCCGFGPFLEPSAASASAASKSKLCQSKHTFDYEKVQSSQNIKIESMYIETSSDVTLQCLRGFCSFCSFFSCNKQ